MYLKGPLSSCNGTFFIHFPIVIKENRIIGHDVTGNNLVWLAVA